jgi:DNA-binding beta-propeller fold protein YncE
MTFKRFVSVELAAVLVCGLWNAPAVGAATVRSVTVFAQGAEVNASGPDSIAVADDSIWVSYTNGADSTGQSGSSTVVQYSLRGRILRTFSIPGYVDGLKLDPRTGLVWAMQNQDGNSTLTLIDPDEGITPDSPIPYAVTSSSRGYDEVVFRENRIFLSYTNPTGPGDPTIQMLVKGSNPLAVTTILTMGATGTNLATGQANQPTTQNDPDSLKLTPFGDLQLTSGDDGQLIFVAHPGTDDQAVSFLTLLDPHTGLAVSGLDDAVFATARRGVFYLADTGNNRVLAINADDLEIGTLFASVGSVHALVIVDLKTGRVSPFLGNLNGPHGLVFQARRNDDREEDGGR